MTGVQLRAAAGEVEVRVEHSGSAALECAECGASATRYDTRLRRWRHLPTCQYRTILATEVPRVRCPEHGVKTLAVPWSEPGSGFTALLEAPVMDWLREASTSAVARHLDLTWDPVDGVRQRAVQRGLARRRLQGPRRLGVDETSFQKRHEYATVVADLDGGVVEHVADGRGKEALTAYWESFSEQELAQIQTVAMDVWGAYIAATSDIVPDAESKIAFDQFHVAMHLGTAVDRVRREESRVLRDRGDASL